MAADSTTRQEQPLESSSDDWSSLREFLKAYPIPLHHSRPEEDCNDEADVFVFWSQNDRTDDRGLAPDSPEGPSEIHHKLKELLREIISSFPLNGLIQFWSIVKTGSRCLLATDNQPFALCLDSDSDYIEYRLRSHEYKYDIDLNNPEVEEDPFVINSAPVINVFRSHLAEFILDLRLHQGSPLVRCALECGFMSCLLIPICDASQSHCVGVLECYWLDSYWILEYSNRLLYALQKAGLRTFKVQKDLLYKSIGILKHKDDEIIRALKVALHFLSLAQVSIPYEDENRMKRMVALELFMQPMEFEEDITDYLDHCDILPVKIMEGLAEKALENYEPLSCRDIYEMSNVEQPVTNVVPRYSCLVICFKRIHTAFNFKDDHVDYVFEFLWPREEHYETMIKGIISTLTGCLPNFKFASGADVGDALRVIDVGNFSESGIQTILEPFKEKKQSPIPKVFEEGRKRKDGKGKTHKISLTQAEMEEHKDKTQEEAARIIGVSESTLKRKWGDLKIGSWPGPKGGKRKERNPHKDQIDMDEVDNRVIQAPLAVDEDTVTIKAEYQDDLIKLRMPRSLITVEDVKKQIGDGLKLNAGSFKLKYCDGDGEWVLLVSADNMTECIEISKRSDNTAIKLRVIAISGSS